MHACIYVLHLCIYCVGKCAYLAIFSSQPWLCVLLWFLLSQIVRHSPLRAVASGLLYHLPGTQSWWLLGAVPVPRQKSQSAQPRRLSVNSMHMKMDQSSHTHTYTHQHTNTNARKYHCRRREGLVSKLCWICFNAYMHYIDTYWLVVLFTFRSE